MATVNKVAEGRPHVVDLLKNNEIALVVNTVEEKRAAIQDSYHIRRAALVDQVPTFTTRRRRARRGDRHARDAGPDPLCAAGPARAVGATPCRACMNPDSAGNVIARRIGNVE